MQPRTIGGIEVSPLGLGTSRMASLGAHRSRSDASRLLDAAADLGVTLIDTADTYGSTACERWLGEAMKGRSHRFVIVTKSGLATADLPGPFRPLNQPTKKVMQRTGRGRFLEPGHIQRSIEASLKRLHRERIEIYLLHSPPPGVEQRHELFGVLQEAHIAGKIGIYGVSSPDPGVIKAVAEVQRCEVAETGVNPLATHAIRAALKPVESAGGSVELIANHVLITSALLSGSAPKHSPSAMTDLVRKLDSLSAERGVSRAHLLLRHAGAIPQVRVVLTGTNNPAHLAANVAALAEPPRPEDLIA